MGVLLLFVVVCCYIAIGPSSSIEKKRGTSMSGFRLWKRAVGSFESAFSKAETRVHDARVFTNERRDAEMGSSRKQGPSISSNCA